MFGEELRKARLGAGRKQQELGDALGVGKSLISRLETEILPPPSVDTIERLAALLHVDPSDMLIAMCADRGYAPFEVMHRRNVMASVYAIALARARDSAPNLRLECTCGGYLVARSGLDQYETVCQRCGAVRTGSDYLAMCVGGASLGAEEVSDE